MSSLELFDSILDPDDRPLPEPSAAAETIDRLSEPGDLCQLFVGGRSYDEPVGCPRLGQPAEISSAADGSVGKTRLRLCAKCAAKSARRRNVRWL